MANMTVTNVDLGSVVLSDAEFRDELIAFGGADVLAEGTIMARRRVALAVTASAVTGSGDGTVTAATVVAGSSVPVAGVWILRCVTAVANGGVWQLEDPNGSIVATGLTMTVGAGAATVFSTNGLQFTITDGAADFAAGDTATLTVAADGKMVPFATDGAGGAQIPAGVLTYDVTATGAGNVASRIMISGRVRTERLIIDADGDGSNVTSLILDQLRDASIVPVSVEELNILDNQ